MEVVKKYLKLGFGDKWFLVSGLGKEK